jgi:hypothetical protein
VARGSITDGHPRGVPDALALRDLLQARRFGELTPSSAPLFDGWREKTTTRFFLEGELPVTAARTWLLATGWRRRGLISFGEAPSAGSGAAADARGAASGGRGGGHGRRR